MNKEVRGPREPPASAFRELKPICLKLTNSPPSQTEDLHSAFPIAWPKGTAEVSGLAWAEGSKVCSDSFAHFHQH
jgi:hypothetical protein